MGGACTKVDPAEKIKLEGIPPGYRPRWVEADAEKILKADTDGKFKKYVLKKIKEVNSENK